MTLTNHDWRQYKRKGLSEMRTYMRGEDLSHVSISEADKENGSPKEGDMIARNPKNHKDQWLVAEKYFEDNLELADTEPEHLFPLFWYEGLDEYDNTTYEASGPRNINGKPFYFRIHQRLIGNDRGFYDSSDKELVLYNDDECDPWSNLEDAKAVMQRRADEVVSRYMLTYNTPKA